MKTRWTRPVCTALLALSVAGCSAADRLANIGETPALSAIEDPTTAPGYQPVNMPMPDPEPPIYNSNSLWRTGSRAFFEDQRAARIGDILTVQVQITDRATLDNRSERSRDNSEDFQLEALVGLESAITNTLPADASTSGLVNLDSDASSDGSGSIDREERIQTQIAAVITQVLPNGNLVIEGRQEVRVNFEVRELIVAGIVRPEDIASDNTIDSSKIAEARISYGGRGQITDVQQPRYGQQVLDVLLPF
ncbi:MAG: flagellar basal body L-ring protein FlgH [Pseudomonadota bacterium]